MRERRLRTSSRRPLTASPASEAQGGRFRPSNRDRQRGACRSKPPKWPAATIQTNDTQTNSSVAALVACQRSDVQISLAINCDDPALAHGPKIGLLKIEHAVSVVESAHNLTPYVPEVALLRCVGTRQLVEFLLWRHDDPLLAQQNLGQACAPHEERVRQGVRLNRAEVENPACEAVLSDECHKSIVEAFDVFGRKDACELRQKYAVVTVK